MYKCPCGYTTILESNMNYHINQCRPAQTKLMGRPSAQYMHTFRHYDDTDATTIDPIIEIVRGGIGLNESYQGGGGLSDGGGSSGSYSSDSSSSYSGSSSCDSSSSSDSGSSCGGD
jgi:hypothetical protein